METRPARAFTTTTKDKPMAKPAHPFLRWPGSMFWILPLLAAFLLFWRSGSLGSLWSYLVISPLVALVFIDLFSTVWFGISTLAMIFIYSSVGSSGVPVSFAIWEPSAWVNLREMRAFELTEFEWFHWWPFKCLIATLCLNMGTVTIRKIKFSILTVGVWTIHTGVIVTVLGCLVYFSQKIEGDVLVSRRQVVIQSTEGKSVSMVATPGNSIVVDNATFTITDINPNWTLMSGDDKGDRVYAVTIEVQSAQHTFMRQLIAGYPEYTEDIIPSNDPKQPMARAKKVIGKALFDDELQMSLEYDVKEVFYVTQSSGLYIRELSNEGSPLTGWIERPIVNLPRFNDYIAERNDVWQLGKNNLELHPLSIAVNKTDSNDPLDQEIIVDGYLRYAYLDTQVTSGGPSLFPVVWATLRKGDDAMQSVEMHAFNPSANTADDNLTTFRWLTGDGDLEALQQSLAPRITATILGTSFEIQLTNNDEFTQIGDTEYFCKINSLQNNLAIGDQVISLVVVEIKHGDKVWQRWVFDNPSMNRDVIEGANHEAENSTDKALIDTDITFTYIVGAAPITIVGGLSDGSYMLLTSITGSEPTQRQLVIGEPLALTADVTLTLNRVEKNAAFKTMPTIVPFSQREPSASNMYSMIKVVLPTDSGSVSAWLPYHHYPVESKEKLVQRFQFKPTTLQLPNGKTIQLLFSRRRALLPAPVSLERFEVDSHLGGFTGSTSSILNWRSIVRFIDESKTELSISVNDPQSLGDFWFFQSQWDPPDGNSQGLNYTVLGVGNRHGVFTMLFGCCLTVSGMLWAFYVKPMIKRKRQQAVYAEVLK